MLMKSIRYFSTGIFLIVQKKPSDLVSEVAYPEACRHSRGLQAGVPDPLQRERGGDCGARMRG